MSLRNRDCSTSAGDIQIGMGAHLHVVIRNSLSFEASEWVLNQTKAWRIGPVALARIRVEAKERHCFLFVPETVVLLGDTL